MSRALVLLGLCSVGLVISDCRLQKADSPVEVAEMGFPQGRYLGFTRSSQSPIGFGEVEVVIKDNKVDVRIATGEGIRILEVDTTNFEPMKLQEVVAIFKDDAPFVSRISGFKHKLDGFPKYLFFKDPSEYEYGLVVLHGSQGAVSAVSTLFNPTQIGRGDYDFALLSIEKKHGPGKLPMLSNQGKAGQALPQSKSF